MKTHIYAAGYLVWWVPVFTAFVTFFIILYFLVFPMGYEIFDIRDQEDLMHLKKYIDKAEFAQGRTMQVLGRCGNHITRRSDEDSKDVSSEEENILAKDYGEDDLFATTPVLQRRSGLVTFLHLLPKPKFHAEV